MAQASVYAVPSLPWLSPLGRLSGLGLALAVIIAISGYCFAALTEARRSADLTAHAQEMLVQLRDLVDGGREMGDAARLYLTTGGERYLLQHRAALAKARNAADAVGLLARGDDAQERRWATLEQAIMRGLTETGRLVERRAIEPAGAPAITLPSASSEAVERIRAGVREMLHAEGLVLRAGSERAKRQATMAQSLLIAGTVSSLLLILAVFALMRREMQARLATASVLARVNAGLEAAVADRVHELAVEIEERRRAGEMLEALAQQSSLGIIALDPERRVTLWNPAAEHIFGYTADEIVGEPYPIVPEDLRDEHNTYFQRFSSGEFLEHVEVVRQRKDGQRIRTVFSGAALYGPNGALRGVAFMCEDVTQRRAMEEQLRQAQKMEAIGQLTGGIAHDFNNLLLVIQGTLELAEEDLADRPEIRQDLQRAIRASERGATLTRSLLAFARKQPLSPTTVDLNRLVRDMVDLLERTLGEAIEIKLVSSAALWQCEVDSGLLQNALLNLAINARDAMPSGGKLTIETRNAPLDEDYAAQHAEVAPGDYVSVVVSDTGSGMSPEVIARVFEPFFTTKSGGKGNGLGLSMVYGFVKQSGGHIKVYSELGVGTTIRLYMPRSDASDAARVTGAEAEDLPGGSETVLVVEDDADVRSLAIRQLSSLGYTTLDAPSGAAALELLAASNADLLLTDIILSGGMNGKELADLVGRDRPTLRVLYMSGYTEDAILHHGRLEPGVQLLQKPFRKRDLAAKLRAVLGDRLQQSK